MVDLLNKQNDIHHIQESIKLRQHIHTYPELSFKEHLTTQTIIDFLEQNNILYEKICETGVIAIIKKSKNNTNNKSIGLRADIDALPIQEQNSFEYASKHNGVMHACGHDGHTAILMCTAYNLQHNIDFEGTVYCIFQPAEEHGAGAAKMIEHGLFTKFDIDCIFAMHNWPDIKEGHFGLKSGAIMASSNEFRIDIQGKGGHAAMPHQTNDPILCSAEIMLAFQIILTRNISPLEQAVISITQMHGGGDATNIIPDSAWIGGTVRTFSIDTLDIIQKRMEEMANHVANAHNCTVNFKFTRNYPPTINTLAETQLVSKVLTNTFGADCVNENVTPTMGAEDFSFMLQQKKGCYFFIGNGNGSHRQVGHGLGPCQLHNHSYDFNDNLVELGAKVWIELVKEYLS
jgi:hippurate hydrolase